MLSYPLPRIGKNLEKSQFEKTCDIRLLLIGRRVRRDQDCRLPPTQQMASAVEKISTTAIRRKSEISHFTAKMLDRTVPDID